MRGEIENWNNGWYGVSVGLSHADIDRLIELLRMLRADPAQHFHMSSDYSGDGGIGDIKVYVAEVGASSNLQLSGLALSPDDNPQIADEVSGHQRGR